MRLRPWSECDERFLRDHYASTSLEEIAESLGRTVMAVRSRAKILRLRRRDRRPWSAEDIETLRQLYADRTTQQIANQLNRPLSTTYHKAYELGLEKSEAYLASPAACRLRRGDGVGSRFTKGHVPWSKGLRRPGYAPGRMKETQFKKGEVTGRNLERLAPLGATRISSDGTLQRKVTNTGRGAQRWKSVHQLVWIEAHGPLPPGHVVLFLAGQRTTVLEEITVDRLELVSNAELMRRNTIHRYPPELQDSMRLLGRVRKAIERRES